MDNDASQNLKKRFLAVLAGTVLITVCCFTPILVILLGAIGFSAFTAYLDLVFLPALVIMIALTIIS